MTHVAKFLERHLKAKDPKNPFPADRVFPSVDEQLAFGEELRDLLTGLEEHIERLERQIRQINM